MKTRHVTRDLFTEKVLSRWDNFNSRDLFHTMTELYGSNRRFGSSEFGSIQVACFGKHRPVSSFNVMRNTMSWVGSKLDSVLLVTLGNSNRRAAKSEGRVMFTNS